MDFLVEHKRLTKISVKTIITDCKETIQPGVLELEKLAWTLGYNTALATFPGMCTWCATSDYSGVNCAVDRGPCHPDPPQAVPDGARRKDG